MKETLNWVERQARSDKNLSRQAVEVWESVRTALDNCCKSFNEHYSNFGTAQYKAENGHRVRVIVTFDMASQPTKSAALEFSGDEIVCTVDGGPAKRFKIAADETHAFLQYGQEEITADRFTEITLRDAFFKLPSVQSGQRRNFAQMQSDFPES